MSSLRQFLHQMRSSRAGGRRGRRIRRLLSAVDRRRLVEPGPGAGKRAGDDGKASGRRPKRLDRATTERERGDDTVSLDPTERFTIEYAPVEDGDPDPGEVVWTWIPYEEDPSNGKDRPVVIIGRSASDLVAVPLTTKEYDDEPQVAIGSGDWDRRRRNSYARVDRVMHVDPDATRREGAVLDRRRFDEIVAAVEALYHVRRG